MRMERSGHTGKPMLNPMNSPFNELPAANICILENNFQVLNNSLFIAS